MSKRHGLLNNILRVNDNVETYSLCNRIIVFYKHKIIQNVESYNSTPLGYSICFFCI